MVNKADGNKAELNKAGQVIDGKALAVKILLKTKIEIDKLIAVGKNPPGLAIILIGNDAASEIYVRNKIRAAKKIGINAKLIRFNSDVSNDLLITEISKLNEDKLVSGIIVQLPLPKQIIKNQVLSSINPQKDVDGFHPINVGRLYSNSGSGFIPCTARGCIELINSVESNLAGKHVVIIGRSNIVGKPLASLLLQANCTVTITHSKTQNLKKITNLADIVVVAVGKPMFLTADYFNSSAIVIDVGINRIVEENKNTIIGDVDFNTVKNHVKYISPVPGGVGPMTIAFLLANCLEASMRQSGKNL